MKLAIVLALAACQAGGGDDYPIGGGGTGPIGIGNGGRGDAGTGDGGDGDGGATVTVTGRVCILGDLRKPTLCDDTKDASRLVLTLGNRPAVTLSKLGEFSFAAALGTDLTWHVRGSVLDQIIPTVMAYGTDNTIPVVETGHYTDDLLGSVSVVIVEGQGSIVVRVLDQGIVAADVRATTTLPTTNGDTFYDGATELTWGTNTATGKLGVVWFPGVPLANKPPTTSRITLTAQNGSVVTTTATVEDQAITFVTQDLH